MMSQKFERLNPAIKLNLKIQQKNTLENCTINKWMFVINFHLIELNSVRN